MCPVVLMTKVHGTLAINRAYCMAYDGRSAADQRSQSSGAAFDEPWFGAYSCVAGAASTCVSPHGARASALADWLPHE
jgi:hypothetical protein